MKTPYLMQIRSLNRKRSTLLRRKRIGFVLGMLLFVASTIYTLFRIPELTQNSDDLVSVGLFALGIAIMCTSAVLCTWAYKINVSALDKTIRNLEFDSVVEDGDWKPGMK